MSANWKIPTDVKQNKLISEEWYLDGSGRLSNFYNRMEP